MTKRATGTLPDGWEIGLLDPVTEAEVHAARLAVCAYSTDADEARRLLAMLGIGAKS